MQEGKIPADNTIGRYLADTVAVVPRINAESFDTLFNDSVQVSLLSSEHCKLEKLNDSCVMSSTDLQFRFWCPVYWQITLELLLSREVQILSAGSCDLVCWSPFASKRSLFSSILKTKPFNQFAYVIVSEWC
jgi:hypothetical protein